MPLGNGKPIIELPAEMRQKLLNLHGDLERAERQIEVLKQLGHDTKALEDQLNQAKKRRDIILKASE